MPTVPNTSNLTANNVDIFNAIRNSASANYQNYVPVANASQDSVREIGAIIMQYNALQNEFLNALVNRIGLAIINSKLYRNPWAVFKRGLLDLGESIEEIYVNIAKPFSYDPAVAENKVFKREIPDVRAAFHVMNYQKFYKATIQQNDLRLAFLSWNKITDLIAKIVESMYTAANYDEFQTMKYLLAKHILNGRLYPVKVAATSAANMKSIVTTIKGVSNKFEYANTIYNPTGVTNHSLKEDQYIIVNADFDAAMDVEVLASAFNMSKAEFMGHRVMIDSFGSLDKTRLNELFANDPNYVEISDANLTALDAVPAVIIDRDWFMIYDNISEFTEQYNAEGLYWNYFYHVWKTFSASPFANAVVFAPGDAAVTAVTVSPSTASAIAGSSVVLSANVTADYFDTKAVTWSCETEGVEIDPLGVVTIGPNVGAGNITVTATTVGVDSNNDHLTASATITVVSTVTSVTVTPASPNVAKGTTKQFSATVAGSNIQDVTWAITTTPADATGASISEGGLLTITAASTATKVRVTATSVDNNSVSGYTDATITS